MKFNETSISIIINILLLNTLNANIYDDIINCDKEMLNECGLHYTPKTYTDSLVGKNISNYSELGVNFKKKYKTECTEDYQNSTILLKHKNGENKLTVTPCEESKHEWKINWILEDRRFYNNELDESYIMTKAYPYCGTDVEYLLKSSSSEKKDIIGYCNYNDIDSRINYYDWDPFDRINDKGEYWIVQKASDYNNIFYGTPTNIKINDKGNFDLDERDIFYDKKIIDGHYFLYDDRGNIIEEFYYLNGKKEGQYIRYLDPQKECIEKVKHPLFHEWTPRLPYYIDININCMSAHPYIIGFYDNGKRDGAWNSYFPSGRVGIVSSIGDGVFFKDGIIENSTIYIFGNGYGIINTEGSFLNGRRNGVWTYGNFNRSGSSVSIFDNGILIRNIWTGGG